MVGHTGSVSFRKRSAEFERVCSYETEDLWNILPAEAHFIGMLAVA